MQLSVRRGAFWLLLAALSAACVGLEDLARDRTRLEVVEDGELGRQLDVRFLGGEPRQHAELFRACREELESGDFFLKVTRVEGEDRRPEVSTMTIKIEDTVNETFSFFFRSEAGWISRVQLDVELVDTRGELALAGRSDGIAYDDDTEPDNLPAVKRLEIESAAHRNAIAKISGALRELVDQRIEEEFDKVPLLELEPGVGPLRAALVNIDIKRAHPSLIPAAVMADLRNALENGGPELQLIDARTVFRARERANVTEITGLALNDELRDDLIRHLPSRYIILATARSDSSGVAMEGHVLDLGRETTTIVARAKASARGIGAIRLGSIRLGRALLEQLAEAQFSP